MPSQTRYSDFDLDFTLNPVTRDIAKKNDKNAIRQAIKNLVLMRKYDIPFRPKVSSQIPESLFDNITGATANILKRAVTYTLENFEPRINVNNVDIATNDDINSVTITVEYTINNTGQTDQYSFNVVRTR